jgi:hypothetical protein
VKERGHDSEVAFTYNEYKTAKCLKNDYWLYVVFHCATPSPSLNILRDPVKLHWQLLIKIEHYRFFVRSEKLRSSRRVSTL